MRRFVLLSATLLVVLLSGFYVLDSIFERLGLDEEKAKQQLLTNLMGTADLTYRRETSEEVFVIPRARLLASMATGDKPAAAQEMCAWVKQYVSSPEFAQAYAQRRAALKPPPGNNNPRPDEETIQMTRESVKSTEKELASMKKIKGVPAVTIQSMEQNLEMNKKLLAEWEDPNVEITKWEKRFPADVKQLVRKRLEEYLKMSATVDFNAALKPPAASGTRYFVKPEHEQKSRQWKAIYRAGPEVNVAVNRFVKEWLKQDGGAAVTTPATPAKPSKPAGTQNKGRNPRTG